MTDKLNAETAEYRTALAYYTTIKEETTDPRSLRCLENVWTVGNKMLEHGDTITTSGLARRCLDQFGEPSAQTIYNNSSGLKLLVKKLKAAHTASPGKRKKTSGNSTADQAMNTVLDAVTSPKHRSTIRDIFLENQQLKSDIRILDAFLKEFKAADFAASKSQVTSAQIADQAKLGLTQEERASIREFLETTLYNEGYDLRDGEIFKGRRPLQATGFVAAIMNVLED
ncbi:gamma-mobile-trio protein GmtX [Ruegeria sp. 2012CJ41-6]|uniref:Gamma-mobile-trio protein GmtX n=1 Tax=Ruegeria spongiae TaxID=2942209 RepID=A0ABT0Q364_9RHOB|nr:gamma-mobile-trio protein GmtX [Ruegeria spongiae]MCL6284270.1 gamma-mobile-trio protein GmtX [Ruegeria spongiae]